MTERLVNIPLNKTNFKTELDTIIAIANNNGYSQSIVHNILLKKQVKAATKLIYPADPKESKQWRRLQYIGKTSYKIKNIIHKYTRISIAFYNKRTLHNLLCNNKEKTEPLTKSGVYKLSCLNCDCFYIGQTGRAFHTRISEHFSSYRLGKSDSAFANHLLDLQHHSTPLNVTILHRQEKGKKLDALESFEIRKSLCNNDNILNEQTDIRFSPLTDPSFLLPKL